MTYGSLGAVIVLMLWLYLMGAAVIIGGEINAKIRQAAREPIVQKEESFCYCANYRIQRLRM